MADYKLYLICGGIVVIALLVIVTTIVLYERKKKVLQAETQKKTRELQEKEQRVLHQLQEAERQSQERIRIASTNLARQQEDFNKKVEEFTREQQLREKLDSKTDREITIEMHVKAMRIFEILSNIDGKLSGVEDYSTHIDHTFNSVTNSVDGLKESLATSVAIIKSDLESTKGNIIDAVCDALSKNVKIDEDDINSAFSNAIQYDYSIRSSLEDLVSDAVRSVMDSSLSAVEGHLYSIESKLD